MRYTGLYIHVPFCASKCPYCDFYSFLGKQTDMDAYTDAVCDEIGSRRRTGEFLRDDTVFDTVYFGGGTPSVLGWERITKILDAVNSSFTVTEDAEITVECNPSGITDEFCFGIAKKVNRISLGVQSTDENERKIIGRKGNVTTLYSAIETIKKSGIENISLDVMLGIPRQTKESLDKTLDFCIYSGARHISAYMLAVEKGTYFYKIREKLELPYDDEVASMYIQSVKKLNASGFIQYEISNFAKSGSRSRHNIKYWTGEEYLGIGPSAHSFIKGKRFCFPRDVSYFISGGKPDVYDVGGDKNERLMLALRMMPGVDIKQFRADYGERETELILDRAKKYEREGLMSLSDGHMTLTPEGALVSNRIIADIIFG